YHLGPSGGQDLVTIEPQTSGFWPQIAKLGNNDTIVLSRFAYLRRRGSDLVLESPRAPALLRICDPAIAGAIIKLTTPQKIGKLRREKDFVGVALLGLLVESEFLFQVDA